MSLIHKLFFVILVYIIIISFSEIQRSTNSLYTKGEYPGVIVNTPYPTPSMTPLGCYGCLTHTNINMAKTVILSHVIVTQTTKLHVACAHYLSVCVGYGFSNDLL